MKAVIFDFDGVIHDTFYFHIKKVKEFSGLELEEETFRNIHNGNFFDNIPKTFEEIDWLRYARYIHNEQGNLKLKESIRDTILELSNRYGLYIVSSGSDKNISKFLEKNTVSDCFIDVLGLESHNSKIEKFKIIFERYKLNSSECVFVTDTLGDILEANKLYLKTIAVDFGFHDRDRLSLGKPYKIISDFRDLLKIT